MTQGPGGRDDAVPSAAPDAGGVAPDDGVPVAADGVAASAAGTAGDPHLVPVDADGVAVVTVGTVLWWVAFLVLLVWPDHAGHGGPRGWLAITFCGGVLGLVGIWYTRRRRAAIRRSRAAGTQS